MVSLMLAYLPIAVTAPFSRVEDLLQMGVRLDIVISQSFTTI